MGTTAPVSSAELVDLLNATQRALTRGLALVLQEEAATVDQWRILRALRDGEGRVMGDLAATLEIPHPTLTRLVDALVDSAHLYRTQSNEDRRRVSVHLSTRGQKLLTRLDSLAAAHEHSLRTQCGEDSISELVTALKTVRDRLSEP